MSTVKPITGRQTGDLCRLLEEREAGREEFQFLIEHPDQLVEWIRLGGNVAATFQRDMRKEGWTLLEDAPRRIASVADLELVPFLKEGAPSVGGKELVDRARTLRANYSQHDAEFLLEHQEEIPEEFREFVLVFTETVWQGGRGFRRVACLYWGGRRWDLHFRWLDDYFRGRGRLVRPREG